MKPGTQYSLSATELRQVAELEKTVEAQLEHESFVRLFRSEEYSNRVWNELMRRAHAAGFIVDADEPMTIGIRHP